MKIETIAVHGGYRPGLVTNAAAAPFHQTTSCAFNETQHGGLFHRKAQAHGCTRIMNPTTDALEQRLAQLEGGIGALALASGEAAITCAILALAEQGDNIVSTSTANGGTCNPFATLAQLGIDVRFADPANPAAFWPLVDARTKAVYVESIGNPRGNLVDLQAFADLAHKAGIPLIVDNSLPTPYLCRPFEHGADIVVHSLTKYVGGHGTSIGGAIVDSGKFPWTKYARKFRRLNEPDVAYPGVVHPTALASAAYIRRVRALPPGDVSAAISPPNSFLVLQGIETLAARMDRICENAQAVAEHLSRHAHVKWVRYAGLPEDPDRALAERYLGGRACGILSFGIDGGKAAAAAFIDALERVTRLADIGDAKSLATHPATTTHRALSPAEWERAGITEDMLHLSLGIEHIDAAPPPSAPDRYLR